MAVPGGGPVPYHLPKMFSTVHYKWDNLGDSLKFYSTITEGLYISGVLLEQFDKAGSKVIVKLPPWSIKDLKVLILAKEGELESSRKGKIIYETETAHFLLGRGVTNPVRDAKSCREMWHVLAMDWWHIYDYETTKYSISKSYFEMSRYERLHNPLIPLPQQFPREFYDKMSSFLPALLPKDGAKALKNWRADRDPGVLHAEWDKGQSSGTK
ncbi:unnamed protein product [Calypogeia fissa]